MVELGDLEGSVRCLRVLIAALCAAAPLAAQQHDHAAHQPSDSAFAAIHCFLAFQRGDHRAAAH
jgi:hypothetical protein